MPHDDHEQLAAEAEHYDQLQRQRDQDAPFRELHARLDRLEARIDALERPRRQETCHHEWDDKGRPEATCIKCGLTVYRMG